MLSKHIDKLVLLFLLGLVVLAIILLLLGEIDGAKAFIIISVSLLFMSAYGLTT
jgi:hypothetical protein